jgi:hypothetical protein
MEFLYNIQQNDVISLDWKSHIQHDVMLWEYEYWCDQNNIRSASAVFARVLKEGLLKYKEEILDENRHKVLKHLKCIYERKKRRLSTNGKTGCRLVIVAIISTSWMIWTHRRGWNNYHLFTETEGNSVFCGFIILLTGRWSLFHCWPHQSVQWTWRFVQYIGKQENWTLWVEFNNI